MQWLRYIESVLEEGISKGEIRDINSTFGPPFYGGMGMIVFPEGNPHVLSRRECRTPLNSGLLFARIRKSSTTNNN